MKMQDYESLHEYMDKRFVDKILDETEEGETLKEFLGEKAELLRSYMYEAYPRMGNVGLGSFVAMFYEDDFIYPKRIRMSEEKPGEWSEIRKMVYERDNYTCVYCGARGVKFEVDHKIPFSRGGSDEMDNLVTACMCCNRQKRDKTSEEFMDWRKKNGRKTTKAN